MLTRLVFFRSPAIHLSQVAKLSSTRSHISQCHNIFKAIPHYANHSSAATVNMPPKGHKRKASGSSPPSEPPKKAAAKNGAARFNHSRVAEEAGIVNRDFYPPEMSNERCKQYEDGEIPRPLEVLQQTIDKTADQRNRIDAGQAVVHWFKRDLRLEDNRALHLASEKAKSHGIPLVCVYLVSPQDYQAHLTSAVRVDFELRTLEVLREDLSALDIPLHVETVEKRKKVPARLIELCKDWSAKHVFCNIEYEVDELRREELLTRKCLDSGVSFTAVHDDVILPPGTLETGQGKQYAVYSPWYRAWVAHIHANPDRLSAFEKPSKNPNSARKKLSKVFDSKIPAAPSNKKLTDEEKKRFRDMWPAGEHAAHERLEKFVKNRIGQYNDTRNLPAANSTSIISVHLSTGTLAARKAVRFARDSNSSKKLDGGNPGIKTWISEIAWRDFYKHVLAHWPYVCMNKAWKYGSSDIEWEYNDEHFEKWCNGQTGFPLSKFWPILKSKDTKANFSCTVDAAMRQLNHTGYMHNRCRMAVASFLSKDLMLDWRMGEQYFMTKLIDGDFASNNGGWGFSASVGVDPQPYFRVFNPTLQSEKFDPDGEYIHKWVKELSDIKGKAVHEPYERGAAKEAEKKGYPRPIVNHKQARDRALARYKSATQKDKS